MEEKTLDDGQYGSEEQQETKGFGDSTGSPLCMRFSVILRAWFVVSLNAVSEVKFSVKRWSWLSAWKYTIFLCTRHPQTGHSVFCENCKCVDGLDFHILSAFACGSAQLWRRWTWSPVGPEANRDRAGPKFRVQQTATDCAMSNFAGTICLLCQCMHL